MIASFISIFDAISDIIAKRKQKNSWINVKTPRIYYALLFALYDII